MITLVCLFLIFLAFSPVLGMIQDWLMSQPGNYYVPIVMPLFQWYNLVIIGSAITGFVWLWKVVWRKIKYTRPDDRDWW
jgi:hypothetical protein